MRRYHSLKDELVRKSRESMLAAVQIYNNPNNIIQSRNLHLTCCNRVDISDARLLSESEN